jgi:nickel transport protein
VRLSWIAAAGLAGAAWGHGMKADPIAGQAGVRVSYVDGEAASFCAVKLFAPGATNVYQEATTDRAGTFVFLPGTAGVWRLEIDDGMGHAVQPTVEIGPDGVPAAAPPPGAGLAACRGAAAVGGIGVIFGVFGFLGWMKASRRGRGG